MIHTTPQLGFDTQPSPAMVASWDLSAPGIVWGRHYKILIASVLKKVDAFCEKKQYHEALQALMELPRFIREQPPVTFLLARIMERRLEQPARALEIALAGYLRHPNRELLVITASRLMEKVHGVRDALMVLETGRARFGETEHFKRLLSKVSPAATCRGSGAATGFISLERNIRPGGARF